MLDGPDGDDFTLRPNQIFAVSLHASPLDDKSQREVVSVCGRELLTSYGLRSLNVAHPEFRPHYDGAVWDRDTSYHQGTVWGYLLGHYAIAEYKVTGDAVAAQANLEPIRDHLMSGALGTVSEIFDGVVPHTPRGALSKPRLREYKPQTKPVPARHEVYVVQPHKNFTDCTQGSTH